MVNHTGSANNLWINAVKGRPGEDKRVRQAIALAFDPEIYLERTANGGGNPTKLLLGESSIWSPGVEEPEVDQKAAKKLLEEAKRSEEHTSELQSLMRISYAVFCLKKKKQQKHRSFEP